MKALNIVTLLIATIALLLSLQAINRCNSNDDAFNELMEKHDLLAESIADSFDDNDLSYHLRW